MFLSFLKRIVLVFGAWLRGFVCVKPRASVPPARLQMCLWLSNEPRKPIPLSVSLIYISASNREHIPQGGALSLEKRYSVHDNH